MLFDTVETDLVNEEYFGKKEPSEFLIEGIVGKAGQEFPEHGGSGDIPAPICFLAADQKQRLRKVALPGTGVPGDDDTLFAPGEIESRQVHDLAFIDTLLEIEVKVGQQFAFGQF